MAKHLVKCRYCGETFDANEVSYVMIGRRYAHTACKRNADANKTYDEEDLKHYINELFPKDIINWGSINKEITKLVKDGYTLTGIQSTLEYWYRLKGNDIYKSEGHLGIIPYAYEPAKQYYYAIYLAQLINKEKDISNFKPVEKTVVIPVPQAKEKKIKLFEMEIEDDLF